MVDYKGPKIIMPQLWVSVLCWVILVPYLQMLLKQTARKINKKKKAANVGAFDIISTCRVEHR